MRATFKRLAETVVLNGGAATVSRIVHRDRALILAYHNVIPAGEQPGGDVSLHLPIADLRNQLDAIARTHEVVPLEALLDGTAPDSARPRLAITFDDAYRGAVHSGIPEIAGRGMPVTVFVCPGRLNSASFWWDRYDLQDSAGLNAAAREHALSALGGREESVTEFAGGNDWKVREEPAHIGCASESDLRSISKMPEVTLGSHSWSHPNLVALSEDQLRIELADSRSWLRDRFVNTISCISYPYGLFDDRVQLAARNCGYDFGLAISGGWMSPRVESSFAVPRLNIPAGISTEGFQCRLAGLFC